jgi:predicted DNA-binding transcriptional regulator AlpA
MSDDDTILSVRQLLQRLMISRTTLHHEQKRNPHFPKKIIVSAGRVGYRLSEVNAYLARQQSPDAFINRPDDWRYRPGKAA